jgi:AcrR family transcriptional regulator
MAQVLKEEIRERIYNAAVDVFFDQGYIPATMQQIGEKAGVPAGLIYSYYKNKAGLFDAVVAPALFNWQRVFGEIEQRSEVATTFPLEERKLLTAIFEYRTPFLILVDKSVGTKYEGCREEIIYEVERHIGASLAKHKKRYDPLFSHILAGNFITSLLEILYHYQSEEWALSMLEELSGLFHPRND